MRKEQGMKVLLFSEVTGGQWFNSGHVWGHNKWVFYLQCTQWIWSFKTSEVSLPSRCIRCSNVWVKPQMCVCTVPHRIAVHVWQRKRIKEVFTWVFIIVLLCQMALHYTGSSLNLSVCVLQEHVTLKMINPLLNSLPPFPDKWSNNMRCLPAMKY